MDRQVIRAFRSSGIREGLVEDLRVRVQRRGNPRGDRVQFHPGDLRILRGETDEVPRTAAWLQDLPAGEAELPNTMPR